MSSDRLWQHCYVVSLPDDADRRRHVADDFVERATGLIDRLPTDCELMFFGHSFAGADEIPPPCGVEPARVPRGMFAYLVWPSAAATIIDRVLPLDLPLDECVSHLIADGHLCAYIANPAIAEPHAALTSRIHRPPKEVS